MERHAGSVRTGAWVAVAALGVLAYAPPGLAASDVAPVATPPGITLQALGTGQGYGMEELNTEVQRAQIAFTDAHGMTLYTYDRDGAGRSACTGTCTQTWIPAAAPRQARPMGDWTIFRRQDGTRQWAYRGKPLYTYARDAGIGSSFGIDPRRLRQGRLGYMRGDDQAKLQSAGWHAALIFPMPGVPMPSHIAIREVGDANGMAFVDQNGMTLYAWHGAGPLKAAARQVVSLAARMSRWQPLVAPDLARPIGQWAVITRSDGIRQWAFRGRPLYTFVDDHIPGDANGIGVDTRMSAALVVAFYLPPTVRLEQTLDRGKVLASAAGLTLYRRDGAALDTGGGQNLRHGVTLRPGVGRNIGIRGCEGACLQVWHPFLAPANAQPDGFWDIAVRPDGTRQWVYQGFPLYTFLGDKKPGDMNGNDVFNVLISDDPHRLNDVGTPMHGTAGLFWTVAYPSG